MVAKNEHALMSNCPIARSLDVFGDHWTLLIVRDMLMFGRHEYKELLEAGEGISSNILSDRLEKLRQNGLIDSIPHPDSKKRKLYYLTTPGKELVHVLLSMGHWAMAHMPNSIARLPNKPTFMTLPPNRQAKYLLDNLREWEKRYQIDG